MSIPAKQFILSYSHAMQDVAALEINRTSQDYYYLEIGAGLPTTYGNNTSLLEHLQWKGISIEKNHSYKSSWEQSWRDETRVIWDDAINVDYSKFPIKHFGFIQIDVDDAKLGIEITKKIVDAGITFNFLTFEHDIHYRPENKKYKIKMLDYMQNLNYYRICNDVYKTSSRTKTLYEDWYVPLYLWRRKNIKDGDLLKNNWIEWCVKYQNRYCPRHFPVIK